MQGPPLEFIPCAGLANRLRAIASAMCAAQDIGSPLRILWRQEARIQTAPFRILFNTETLPSWVTFEEAIPPHAGWDEFKEVLTEDDWEKHLRFVGKRRSVKIKSHGRFHRTDEERWLKNLRSLQPTEIIMTKRNTIFNSIMADRIVGVHIRRGDNINAIMRSPSEDFWKKMATFPDTTVFYFATDSVEEREEAIRRFPGRIIVGSPTILGRNDPFGCREAFVDLICLSNCSEIIGSSYSSFSEVAAALGGVMLWPVLKATSNTHGCIQ